MSIIGDQLKNREKTDNENFEEALDSIASAIMDERLREALSKDKIASSAIEEILKYFHCKSKVEELPSEIKSVDAQIDYYMRPFGIRSRKVILDKGWYKTAVGAMLGTLKEDGSAVALIPGKLSGYVIVDIKSGKKIKLNHKTEKLIDSSALCFYEPLPQKSLNVVDLLKFMLKQLSVSDIVLYISLMAISSALGLLSPLFTKWLFSDVLESESLQVLLALGSFVVCYSISRLCFDSFRNLINARIGTKQSIAVEAAVMNRIMSLPTSFFKNYSSGELNQRALYVQSLCSTLFSTIGTTGLTSLFSLIYIGQIFLFAPSLVVPSIIITLASVVFSLISTFIQIKITKDRMEKSAKTSGLTYSTITGIQKIKLVGAEKRMFSRWAKQYSKEAKAQYNFPKFVLLTPTISIGLSLIGTMIIYVIAVKSGVSVSEYYAFNTAFGMVSGAFTAFGSIVVTISNIKPTLEMAKPIMEAEPEVADNKEIVTNLIGSIELSHICFKYDENSNNIIDDLSLKIKAGEYLAIVGSTGCGKSTLMRLLLGFEKPQKGMITYDGKDLNKLDLPTLRSKIGSVMQDGKLFTADIYSNIIISAPELTLDDAWKAATIAYLDKDIRQMPMGMNTIISEGQGGISGGQKQRLMIARAVAPSPKILMFDEATSALDNITQKHVSDAIDSLKCTRIVIAHRLSTIQHANRIVFLEGGKIVEEGTYEELIALNGRFAKLVERQRLEIND